MARLTLNLLGTVTLEVDGQPVRFTRRAGLALLIYLGRTGRTQPRATLAALIAGESDEPKAAMAISNALRDLRAVLGDDLQTDKQTVALAPSLTIVLDVDAFEAAAGLALQQNDLAALRAAAAAYGGEFTRGFVLRDAPAFDDWLHYERERLRDQYVRILEQLADAETRAGDLQAAIATMRRLLAEEPWREEAHRGLMRLLAPAASGRPARPAPQSPGSRHGLHRSSGGTHPAHHPVAGARLPPGHHRRHQRQRQNSPRPGGRCRVHPARPARRTGLPRWGLSGDM